MTKNTRGLLAVLVALAIAGTAVSYTGTYVPGTGINGTPHDLGTVHNGMNYTASPDDTLDRICIFCHTPHNSYKLSVANGGPAAGTGGSAPQAADEFTYLPLWNHTLPNPVPVYTMYDHGPGGPATGAKASQAMANGMTPGNVSLLCLSCHDGSIAVNSYGNAAQPTTSQSTGTTYIAASYEIGADHYLGNHHPVGFDYIQAQLADPEIRDASLTNLTATSLIADHLYGDGSGANVRLECASCHSVHNTGNSGEALLWRSDQNSELCLTCHAKGQYTNP